MNSTESTKRDWYLIFCKPHQEMSARTNLERQGYEVYLPLIRGRKRSQGRRVPCLQPMFPRYLFIHLGTGSDNWAPIRSTIGVSHLVKFGFEPAKVPDDLITALMFNAGDEGIFEAKETEFKPGDHLRIAEGVMAGYEGIVLARTGKDRVQLLLNFVSCGLSNIEIADDQLELVV